MHFGMPFFCKLLLQYMAKIILYLLSLTHVENVVCLKSTFCKENKPHYCLCSAIKPNQKHYIMFPT